jgi:pimeloyl-ACP methyl ester carboxylesterase
VAVRSVVRSSDGVELAVTEFGGDGPPILLLHGLMGRASTWWPAAQWLADHGRVVGLDARGHGRSAARGPWTSRRLVADIAEAMATLGMVDAVVIGHSMGGLHGWQLAASHPDLVRGLVVLDMAADLRGRTVDPWRDWLAAMPAAFDSLAAVRAAFGWPRPSLGEYLVECVEERADGYHLLTRLEDLTAIAAEWGERDYWAEWLAVRCPVLLLAAEESLMPAGQLAEMASRGSDAGHAVLAGTGHLVHADAPAAFRAAVTAFLVEIGCAARPTDPV